MIFFEVNNCRNKIREIPIVVEKNPYLAGGEFYMKSYVGNTPPNHHFSMMGHQNICNLFAAPERYYVTQMNLYNLIFQMAELLYKLYYSGLYDFSVYRSPGT